MMNGSGGAAPRIAATHNVALFDPRDGRIVHMHHVVVFAGGKPVTPQQAESEAVAIARRRGHKVDRLELLTVAGPLPREKGRFRVDLARRALVPLEDPLRRRGR